MEKNCKNFIRGINNVDPKPEPNVHKNIFSIIYPFLRGLFKNDDFLEKHFTEIYSDSDSPVHGESNEDC